jgi:multidrug efflux pump subunit AcrA (membrane-fusion protein)
MPFQFSLNIRTVAPKAYQRIAEFQVNESGSKRMKNLPIVLLLVFAVLSGCSSEPVPEQRAPRPVSYLTLKLSEPGAGSRLTGSVESWKREDIGFEVAGRVKRVVEPGVNIVGQSYDEQGNLLTEGTVLAELDSERYEIAAKQAQAAADAARTDLEEVVPQMLAEAEAALALADKELERYTNLVASQSAPQQRLDQAETAQKQMTAKVAQVEALRATKAALLNTSLAAVEQAQVNIDDCKLYSPFTGQVARVLMIPGGYSLPGQAVVTVQMMDPMKVNIAVSVSTDSRINQNDLVRVFSPDGVQFEGRVYLKDTFADQATRTFLVTLLVRNRRITVGVPDELREKKVATCRNLWKLDQPQVGSDDNYYAEVDAIQKDDAGHFVWKVENLTQQQLYEDFDPVLTVKKVRVTPGEGRVPILQVFTFRELIEIGELDPATDVIVGDITGQVEDGGNIVLVRERWQLRPGDIVRVGLKGEETAEGYYVPSDAIQFDGQNHYVCVAQASGSAHQTVRVTIEPGQTVGKLQRIDGALEAGLKVIVEGAHYLQVGEKVNPIEEMGVQP